MSDVLPFLVIGLTSGSLYGLAGIGLVLTYRTSGLFNFAHGAVAAAAAYVVYDLHVTHGVAWPVAVVISVAACGLVGGTALAFLVRRLHSARTEISIACTVGLLLFIQGFLQWKFGAEQRPFAHFLPTRTVEVAGVGVQYAQIIIMVCGAVLAGGLYAFLRLTRVGKLMRGLVDDRSLVSLAGFRPGSVERLSWMIGSSLAALSGILIAPVLGLDSVLLTLLVVQAFGACAIGLFSSLPLTYVGGLAVGVAAAFATKASTAGRVFQGLSPSMPFLVLFAVLLAVPARRMAVGRKARPAAPRRSRRSPATAWIAGGLLVGGLALVPSFADVRLSSFTTGLALVPALLSLALLVHLAGSISLCHAAMAAWGACIFSHLTHGLGLPWMVALVLAALSAAPLGALVAIPAVRVHGIYLALATFGFGILLERVLYPAGVMFGAIGSRQAPRPQLWSIDGSTERGFYFVVLLVVLGTIAVMLALVRRRFGRLLRALGDAPVALATEGLSVNVTRVLVFCLAAVMAAVSGALLIAQTGRAGGTGFGAFQSLFWLAVLVVCGRGLVSSAVAAAALLAVLPAYAPDGFTNYQTMLFGAAAVLATVVSELDVRGRAEAARIRRAQSPVRARTACGRPAPAPRVDRVAVAVGRGPQ